MAEGAWPKLGCDGQLLPNLRAGVGTITPVPVGVRRSDLIFHRSESSEQEVTRC